VAEILSSGPACDRERHRNDDVNKTIIQLFSLAAAAFVVTWRVQGVKDQFWRPAAARGERERDASGGVV
jgi:hypothetical protein